MRKIALWVFFGCVATAAVADELVAAPELTSAQIVERNVAARGGLEAWRNIQTMVWVGHVENATLPAPSLPFILEFKRPNKTRFEIKVQNHMMERIYDGIHGWKVRPAGSGQPELLPYTDEELRFARDGQGIEGPLIDHEAKGIAISLDGTDEVEGHKAYRLSVKLPSGASHHVWVDAQTFLDVKYDRQSRSANGQSATVAVFYRNYNTIEGLQIPLMIETRADNAKATDKMVIDKISFNPPLDDKIFANPAVLGRRSTALRDTLPSVGRAIRGPASFPAAYSGLLNRTISDSARGH